MLVRCSFYAELETHGDGYVPKVPIPNIGVGALTHSSCNFERHEYP